VESPWEAYSPVLKVCGGPSLLSCLFKMSMMVVMGHILGTLLMLLEYVDTLVMLR